MKIGIIKEGKIPGDQRVPLTPSQCRIIQQDSEHTVVLQSCQSRCYTDEEYRTAGIEVVEDLSDCDLILGVKEVPIDLLLADKTYMFFSHTIKKQTHNRKLLQEVLKKKITLIDYETITDPSGNRLIAFGRFAGMVGAHNGLMTYGSRTGLFSIDRMFSFPHYVDAKKAYEKIELPDMRIVLTGTGRVGQGAATVLRDMDIQQVSPKEYLSGKYAGPVFTQLHSSDYAKSKLDGSYDRSSFHAHPEEYTFDINDYLMCSDVLINGIFWDKRGPAFFELEDLERPDFRVQVIADVTCDIAPASSIPTTLRASTIDEPVYGVDRFSKREVDPFQPQAIDVMAIDNLPNELPRDASKAFGGMFLTHILPELDHVEESDLLNRAAITSSSGELTNGFSYLQDFVMELA